MKSPLLNEIKSIMNDFFSNATDNDIKAALKEAKYEEYTGVDPDSLTLHQPITSYCSSDSYSFTYSTEVRLETKPDYVFCFDCKAPVVELYATEYLSAA